MLLHLVPFRKGCVHQTSKESLTVEPLCQSAGYAVHYGLTLGNCHARSPRCAQPLPRSLLTLLTMALPFLIFYRPSTLDAGLRYALDIFLGGGSSQLHSLSTPSWRRDPRGDNTGHSSPVCGGSVLGNRWLVNACSNKARLCVET